MQRYLISEPAEVTLTMLADALDLVDFGIVLLNRDLRALFINRRFGEMWHLPPDLVATAPSFRELLQHAAGTQRYDVPLDLQPAYVDLREDAVRAGSVPSTLIDLADGRHFLFRCIACRDGGRILTYADISTELRHEAASAVVRISAELRFNSEMLEDQAAHLASLAEAAEDSAQKAEAARLMLEHEVIQRRQLEMKLRRLATTDGLTGAFNRNELLTSAQREMDTSRGPASHAEQRMAVLMLDVDHFKAINDQFGHAGGDRALEHLVATLRAGIRQIDLLGRLGGEEFAVVLPDTSPFAAGIVAERLRARVAEAPVVFGGRSIPMTVSVGLAMELATDSSIEQVIARADDALYRAKRGGRNRVERDQQPAVA